MVKTVKYSWQFYFVLAIPLINAIASNTSEYFSSDIFNTGNLRALIIGVFAVYFIVTVPNEGLYRFIILYLVYYMILALFSTDRLLSGNLFPEVFPWGDDAAYWILLH